MVDNKSDQVAIRLSTEELEAIETWRAEKGIGNRSAAMRKLIQTGLTADDHAAERIKALESQLALLAGATFGVVFEAWRIQDVDDSPATRAVVGNLPQILESLPFLKTLPTALLFLNAMAARRDARQGVESV